MWIRKSDIDISRVDAAGERKRRSFVRPAIYGLLWSSGITFAYYLGFRGTRRAFMFAPTGRLNAVTVIMGVMIFAIVAGIVYRKQLRGEKFFGDSTETLLCNGCWRPSSAGLCGCGGSLEPYEYYEWQEDQTDLRAEEPSPA